ncbi:DUF3878 family protein [Anaerocolumna chitinilytica]|uniref:Uncharacterized protein n=1 Tax=Anaerocolumna chitinilytica TaxID=1727145 RepID=A0A7I8DT78_9FIRM|nr:DUF3878 family protein [Anaerocolumna chitinilytica]BCK00442.1 hypothetical protein bsdcttw_34820 [Anaerocolumna chitinilytica]
MKEYIYYDNKFLEKYNKKLDDSIKVALKKILDCEYMFGFDLFQYEDGVVTLSVDSSEAFEQWLLFYNAKFSKGFDISLYPYAFELYEDGNSYCLEFIQDNEAGNQICCKLQFSTVNAEIRCFNYTKNIIYGYEPWRAVANFLCEMKSKRERIGTEFLSEEEMRLLPLAEFALLTQFFGIMTDAGGSKAGTDIFISYAERANASNIVSLARQYLRLADRKKEKSISKKLKKVMVRVGAEPVYRMILNEIKSSTALYPYKINSCGNDFFAEQTRENITTFFLSQGFQGDYPYFRKMSTLRGLHYLYIAGQLVALWNKKHMASYIDCYEKYVNGELSVQCIVGTVFLKREQIDLFSTLSADSGFFIDKNRRRGRVVLSTAYWEMEGLSLEEENFKVVEIASRVAQCARLTQKERKKYLSYNPLPIEAGHILLLLWLFGGCFFGTVMCVGFILMETAAGLIFTGSWPRTWALIRETPWHWIFVTCGASFGLTMLVLSLIGRKRG